VSKPICEECDKSFEPWDETVCDVCQESHYQDCIDVSERQQQELKDHIEGLKQSHQQQLQMLSDVRSAELQISNAQVKALQGRIKELEEKLGE
jgi:hypothetical protein